MTASATALIGTRKGLFTMTLDGDRASLSAPAFAGAPVINAMADRRDGTLYASLDHGHFGVHLHRSDDAGSTWVEIAAPEYPQLPDGETELNPMSGKVRPSNVQMAWVLEAGHNDEPGVLWCGTIPAALFRSADRGDSWQLVEGFWNLPARQRWFGGGFDEAGVHSICVDPRGPGRVVIGVSCGGAWRTDDSGQSWEIAARGMIANFLPPEMEAEPELQDPHRVVRCPSQPDALWTQQHFGIFRSLDNGDSWTEIADAGPSTFGFAVVVHPNDPDTAWFVPAISDMVRVPVDGKLVVTRTRDGGATFDVLDHGLPDDDAYDLIYRHGLDIDGTGERLVMGSTTGSLWWSADAGDHWHQASANLPPIASVRWI